VAEVLLFHHAQGLTPGVVGFADELRQAGHVVHVPDLFDGRTFGSIDEGMAYAQDVGFGEIIERGTRAADRLPQELVYAGFSLGVLPAQKLAQTRPGAQGALLFYSCVPAAEFGSWPDGVPVQIHGMDADPIFVGERADSACWFEVGRAYEHFALAATALGVRTAFVNQPVEVPAVRTQFAQWLGLGAARPDLVVRFGSGSQMPYSLRRPVADVIV